MPLIRLDKYISDCGVAARREIKQIIKSGRVSVNGETAALPEQKLDPETATVSLDGNVLRYEKYRYYMLNKPSGILSATDDGKQKTVLDLFPKEYIKFGLFPVGRLDKDTTGLLIITNDGEFAHKVISPKSEIVKTYLAGTESPVDQSDVEAFRNGIVLGDGTKCLPAELSPLCNGMCLVSVMEGKYHQVKRMLAACGKHVISLKRISIGGLSLDNSLSEGQFRELTQDELCRVMKKK